MGDDPPYWADISAMTLRYTNRHTGWISQRWPYARRPKKGDNTFIFFTVKKNAVW